jgi:acetyl-CoA acetyltransferase family protein
VKEPLLVLAGVRTPFGRSGGALSRLGVEDLGTLAARELLLRTGVPPDALDAVVAGNVGQPTHAANVARVIALRAGIPAAVPAHTVHRNCASGFEALTQCADQFALGRGRLFLALGVESMSNYPLLFGAEARSRFEARSRAKTRLARFRAMLRFRPAMFRPEVALLQGLRDPVVGLGMGETAELLAREWGIGRAEQDAFALESHRRAHAARERLREECLEVLGKEGLVAHDEGVRPDSSLEALARLRPVFAPSHGSVTAGNSSQISDGAVALLAGGPEVAERLGLEPLGRLSAFAYAGLDPARMGLGPVYATHRLLSATGLRLWDFDLVEINEAFAAQVLACLRAFADPGFARREFGRDEALGILDPARLNVNGGAIALGHPVGASGARLVLTALSELRRQGSGKALVSACVGGGQGAALVLERGSG